MDLYSQKQMDGMSKGRRIALLFVELFKISALVIGGGYAIIAVADEVFAKKGWTEEGELLDRLPVFQTIPGLIATHTAVYLGNKIAGAWGAIVAVVAVALPAVAVFTLVAMGYAALPVENSWLQSAFVGFRAALTGIIAATIIRSWRRNLKDVFSYSLMLVAVLAIGLLHAPVALVMIAAIAVGVAAECAPRSRATKLRSTWLPLLVFLKYGALCFGGGFVLVPMYMDDFVGAEANWLQIGVDEFSNIMALSQMTPGPIGVNCATFFGFRFAGVAGALIASAMLLLPGSIIVYFAIRSLEKFKASRIVQGIMRGVRPASTALMLVAFFVFLSLSVSFEDGNGSRSVISSILIILTILTVMKKKLNIILTIWLCAVAAVSLRADDITAAKYPDADAVTVDEIEKVAYKPDGTSETFDEWWTKILTEKGRREESSISLHYSKRYGEAEILSVGAIGEDGRERVIDISKTTKEMTDNSSMGINIYDPLDKVIVCTVPGLQIGETLHVKLRRKTLKPRCENMWSDLSVMEWSHPILKSTFEVTAPAARPLKCIEICHPLGNIVTNLTVAADGSSVYTFSVTNSAQVFPEPGMPPLYTQVQNVRVSTAANWEEVSKWYWNLCAPHLTKTNAAMIAKVNQLLGSVQTSNLKPGTSNPEPQTRNFKPALRAIYKFVSQEVRYMGLTMEDTSPGYAPHDVDITFNNRYGVCRDKAGLLVAMLRLAGFKAFPVLIHVGAKLEKAVPQPFFNHAIVAVENEVEKVGGGEQRKYILMDPTNESTKDLFPAYLCDKSYIVARPEGETLRTSDITPPEKNALSVESKGQLKKDGSIFLESSINFLGINDTAYRGAFAKMRPEDRVKFFERALKRIAPGSEVVRVEIEPKDMRDTERPVVVTLAANLPEMVLTGKTQIEINPPALSKVLGIVNFLLDDTSLEKRKYPLQIDMACMAEEFLELDLGEAVGEPKELPRTGDLKGGLEYTREFTVREGRLEMHRRLAATQVEFSAEEYTKLREALKSIESAERKRPVFAVNRLTEADVHYLLDRSETDISSDRAWTVESEVVKQVLTYAGKKRSAELKFSFNPTVEKFEVVSATVSNLNGKVACVSEKEINYMDCGWAASSPRYAASKQVIVSLPSVEIGSVIHYATRRTVTNAPAAYYANISFDSYSPVDRRIVRVNDFRRELVMPPRLPDEPGQPALRHWADTRTISSNRFERIDLCVDEIDPKEILGEGEWTIQAVRDWMARYVRISGPDLYTLPIAAQLTDPRVVLKERYATRLDYVRTLCALLRGAGYEADVVFAANNAEVSEADRCRDKYEYPNVRAFASAICRVRERVGGFLGLGATERELFVGTENEYAPLGATSYAGSDYYDPEAGEFGVVTVPDAELNDFSEERTVYRVRENGGVDLSVDQFTHGAGVGGFRKRYAEMLPEDRSRHYQALLGSIAKSATATKDLETDVAAYPAELSFECFIPNYAVADGDTLTLTVPPLAASIPTFTGKARKTPFEVSATEAEREDVTILFPEGYVLSEHLPESFTFANPKNPNEIWLTCEVTSQVKDGALRVHIVRTVSKRKDAWFGPEFIELIRDFQRRANARASRTIVARRRL